MKKTLMIVLVLLLTLLNGYGFENDKTNLFPGLFQTENKFTSKEGRFSFMPPVGFNNLKYTSFKTPTDVGDVIMHQYSQELDRGTCFISYYDFPESIFQHKTIQKMLEDGRDRAIQNMKATLKKQESVTVDGYPGISLVLEVPNGSKIVFTRADFIIAKTRAYNYLYLSYTEAELNKTDVKNYFKSFHVLK